IEADLGRLANRFADLAAMHARTPLVGRTWLQQAVPITFGLKAAGWLDAVGRHRARLGELRGRLPALQFGGAAGTLAALGGHGMAVAVALAEELSLALPDLSWHAHRDRVAEVATTLGLLVGTLGKVARDLSLMSQTEVAEASEPVAPGRGGSSSMPQKRNPVGAAVVLAASLRVPPLVSTMLTAMAQEHERGLGGWSAEWETLPEICLLTSGALAQLIQVAEGLELDVARMRVNLDRTGGLILSEAAAMALAKQVDKSTARRLVEEAILRARQSGRGLRDELGDDPQVTALLSASDLDRVFDPLNYLGCAEPFVARALAAHAAHQANVKSGS
ncbi:MAG: lyase family protein, partial [Chloroflexota bacterium]